MTFWKEGSLDREDTRRGYVSTNMIQDSPMFFDLLPRQYPLPSLILDGFSGKTRFLDSEWLEDIRISVNHGTQEPNCFWLLAMEPPSSRCSTRDSGYLQTTQRRPTTPTPIAIGDRWDRWDRLLFGDTRSFAGSMGMRKSALTIASAEAREVPCHSRCSWGYRRKPWGKNRWLFHVGFKHQKGTMG